MAMRWASGAERPLDQEGWFTIGGTAPGPGGGNQGRRSVAGEPVRTGGRSYKCDHTVDGSNAHFQPGDPEDFGSAVGLDHQISGRSWLTMALYKYTAGTPRTRIKRFIELARTEPSGNEPLAFDWLGSTIYLVDNAGNTLASAPDPFVHATWQSVKVDADWANRRFKLIVDGSTIIDYTHGSACTQVIYYGLGGYANTKENPDFVFFLDDLWVNDTANARASYQGRLPDAEPPDVAMSVRACSPNGDTSVEEWQGYPDTANLYANWDDPEADGDSTYNQTADNGTTLKRQLSQFQNLVDMGVPDTHHVWGFQHVAIWSKPAGAPLIAWEQLLSNALWVSESFTKAASTYYAGSYLPRGQDPNGHSWTRENFDAAQLGVRRPPLENAGQPRVTMTVLFVATSTTIPPEQPPPPGARRIFWT